MAKENNPSFVFLYSSMDQTLFLGTCSQIGPFLINLSYTMNSMIFLEQDNKSKEITKNSIKKLSQQLKAGK